MSTTKTERPDSNVYRVRRDTRLNQGLFLCKLIMKKHGTVQIEGLGESISLVAKFSQILSKDGVAVIQAIESQNISESKTINPKMIIRLGKAAKFDELTQNIVPK